MKKIQRQLANNVRLNDSTLSNRDRRQVRNAVECGVESAKMRITLTGLGLVFKVDSAEVLYN